MKKYIIPASTSIELNNEDLLAASPGPGVETGNALVDEYTDADQLANKGGWSSEAWTDQ